MIIPQSRTIWVGDNLTIMRDMHPNIVDLIYLDPPFNSNSNYSATQGSTAEGATFKDKWFSEDIATSLHNDIRDEHPSLYRILGAVDDIYDGNSMMGYLMYMVVRIMELHRILKDTGSLYLHCDPTSSHYLKLVMDAIFGSENFVNEIIWEYGLGGTSKRTFSRKHDCIFLYSKTVDGYKFKKPLVPAKAKDTVGMVGMRDVWSDLGCLSNLSRERTGFPTQKPIRLLKRMIYASSDEGDMVFDPFAGSGTTLVAAEEGNRKWAGIDISRKATDLIVERIHGRLGLFCDTINLII